MSTTSSCTTTAVRRLLALLLASIIGMSIAAPAQAADQAGAETDVDGFGRVLIVGDSIAWDYADVVRAPGTVVNRSIPGTCLFLTTDCWRPEAGTLIQRLRRMVIDPRDTVVIAIGINDLYKGRMSQYSAGYREAVRYVRAQGATPLVATITPYAGELDEWHQTTDDLRVRVNAWLMRSGLPIIDLSSVMGGDLMPNRFDSGDGIHPNPVGRVRLAHAISEALS